MSWNGSGQRGTAPAQPKATPKKPSPVRGLIAGACVVVLAGVAYLAFFSGRDDAVPAQGAKRETRGAIKAVAPAATPKAAPVEEKKDPLAEKIAALRAKYGEEIPKDWNKPYHPKAYRPDGTLKKYSRYVNVVTIKPNPDTLPIEEQTFSNFAERDIARAMLVTPGEQLVGDYTYDESFTQHFLASLKEPIVIDKEKDTPAQQELKEIVIETKKELKARYDAGEDIAAIMNENRAQLKELGLYREDIKKMVAEARAQHGDEFTEQDEKDLIAAANKMLEERGCKPLVMPESFVRQAESIETFENKGQQQ